MAERREPERSVERRVQLLVRTMVGAADDVGDLEVDVVDDRREMECRRTVVAAFISAGVGVEALPLAERVGRRNQPGATFSFLPRRENLPRDRAENQHRQRGHEVFFLTGTDENGTKIDRAAKAKGEETRPFVDRLAQLYKDAAELYSISYDRFIRTTDPGPPP